MGCKYRFGDEPCDNNPTRGKVCETHYKRLRRDSNVNAPKGRRGPSRIRCNCFFGEEPCPNMARSVKTGRCLSHQNRFLRGAPLNEPRKSQKILELGPNKKEKSRTRREPTEEELRKNPLYEMWVEGVFDL